MNIELKPIAESKVRQLGGDVCGVLVRKEDSQVMAVFEHGRCTRLVGGVMGPVDGAQGGQGAKPIGFTWDAGRFGRQFTADAGVADRVRVDGVAVLPVYTQPQPAVPEDIFEALESVKRRIVNCHADKAPSAKIAIAHAMEAIRIEAESRRPLFSTATTPQADGLPATAYPDPEGVAEELVDRLFAMREGVYRIQLMVGNMYCESGAGGFNKQALLTWMTGNLRELLPAPIPPAGQEGA